MNAALAGDAKTALEVLRYKHGWLAATLVKNELTGANGGPLQLAAVDMRKLSPEEIDNMEKLLEKMNPEPDKDNSIRLF